MNHCVCILHSSHTEVFSTISIFENNSVIKFSDVKQSSDFAYREGVLEIKSKNESDNNVGHSIRVVLSFPSNQTSGEIVLNTSHVLDTFKPSLAIIVGTCSGYKDNETPISRGDIIVAQSAFNYQTGINTNDGLQFTLNDCIQANKSLLSALKLTDHSKSDWIKYPSIEVSTTYKREWLLRAFFEYQDHKDNLAKSVWLKDQGFDIKKTPARNTVVQEMFGKQYNNEKDKLVKDGLLEEDENGIPNISDKGFEKIEILLNRYGDYPYNLFKEIKPNIHFGQFGCGSALEQQYEVVNKKRISLAFKQCREKSNGIIAIDRDTHAFYLTTSNYKEISFISIKSVLDYADGDTNQNNNYIDYCNQLSSSLALHTIKSHSFENIDIKTIHNCIPPLPKNVIDRKSSDNKEYIQLISDSFKSKSNSVTISSLISGMGGVGKSTLAKQFAFHCIENQLYQYIFWIHGETNETLLESYKEVLQYLKIEIKNQDNIITTFTSTIQQLKGNILLFYDNVENMALIEKKPQDKHINILITTRSTLIDNPLTTLIHLDLLNENECISLFKKWRPNISDSHITQLSELLQRLPLAISHCLAYIEQVGINEEQYVDEFQMFKEIQVYGDDDSFNEPYEKLIGKTISMAIGKMKNKQDLESRATTLLHFMAFLNPDQIHSKVLEIILKGKDNSRIDPVLNILKQFSLISIDGEVSVNQNYNISIHRVVQRSIIVLLKNNNVSINLIYDNLSHINNQISTYFYSNNTNINIRNSNSNSILFLDIYSNLNNISIHLTNIQTTIQKMDHLPHKQFLELTNKLLLTQIIMQCNHLSYLILNSKVNRQVLEALFLESNIDKNNISELVDSTFQFLNQNQQLTQGIDIKVALNIFSKFISGKGINKERCNIILMFIFISLGKIGHFLDKDIQFFKKISTKRISIINGLLSRLPGQVLNFSQLQNMFINRIASDNEYSNLIDNIVHLNDKVKGLGRSSTEIISNSFKSRSIDPTIIHFTTNLANENTSDNQVSKIFDILMKYKFTFSNDQTKIIVNYIDELFEFRSLKYCVNKLLEVFSNIKDFEKFNHDQIQNLFRYIKLLINEKFNYHHISSIISTMSEQTTKYKLPNDQFINIINYTIQLINEKMNCDHISLIISILSEQISKFNNDQIQSIINHTKQLINENTNDDHLYKIISTLSHQITIFNGQIIINYTKQLFNENMNHMSPVLSILSKLIPKFKFNNDLIQTLVNYTKQFINEHKDGFDRAEIISALSQQITKYKFNNEQIQTIINYTKQLINEKMIGYHISVILSTISEQITKYQLNNGQIQTIINYTKQFTNENMFYDDICRILSIVSQIISKNQLNDETRNYPKIPGVLDQTRSGFHLAKQLINEEISERITEYIYNQNMGGNKSETISTLPNQKTKDQIIDDQVYFNQLYNENIENDIISRQSRILDKLFYKIRDMKGDISEIILALIPKTQITKYKFKNDQIQTIINYTKQLIHPNMNYFHIESIISTLSYLSHDQIQILINYSKQFIKKEMNGHEISSIISTLSKQITEYKLNNDQIQAIINYTKEMNGYEISSIISTLSKQITEYKLNNGQIQAIINYTKQLINQKMNGYHISKIILTLSEGLHNDQIQNIINYTKQLIDEKTNGDHILSIVSTLSEQITKYQLNNHQIQNIFNYTKLLIKKKKDIYHISSIISNLSKQISQDPSNFKECFKNNIILKTCSHLGFRYSFSKILHLYSNNPLAFEQSYICILSLYQRVKSNQFLNFLDIVIACNSEERNYILAKFISEYQDEINAQTINLTQDKIISLKEKDNCCLKNRHNSLDENDTHKYDTTLSDTDEYNTDDTNENDTDENYTDDTDEYNTDKYDTDKYYSNGYYTYETDTDEYDTDEYDTDDTDETDTDEYDTDEYDTDENDTDTQALFMKLNDVKEHIQDYDFKILCRQLSFHPNLFKESIIKSFIKIKNSLGPDVEQHDFQYLIFQSLYPYDDDQLELVCDIIEKTREHKQEYFCCNLHIANNIQRLYYYNYKFTIGNNNFLQVFYSQLKDIDNKSNLECMKTVLLNTLNPKIRFNANI